MFSLPLPLTTVMSVPKRLTAFFKAVLAFRLEGAAAYIAAALFGSSRYRAFSCAHGLLRRLLSALYALSRPS
ncbi:MAG: hypothetical protein LBD29_01775 [Treponema sp.]|nr:hypothetical protein [Treponema sp.]